jgi:hypothetical protein
MDSDLNTSKVHFKNIPILNYQVKFLNLLSILTTYQVQQKAYENQTLLP